MALSGSFTTYTTTPSETEFITATVTYPENLPDWHPDYAKRGTSEEISQPVIEEVGTLHESKYIVVSNVALSLSYNTIQTSGSTTSPLESKDYYSHIMYRIYSSSEARDENFDSYETGDVEMVPNNTGSMDIIEFAYTKIKEQKGFGNLIDV